MGFYITNYSYMFVIINFGDILAVTTIKLVRKEEGKSYWKIPLCDDDATREK